MKKNSGLKNYIRYSYLGFQIAIMVTIGVLGGQWLDKHFHLEFPVFTITCSLVMIAVALYQVIKIFL